MRYFSNRIVWTLFFFILFLIFLNSSYGDSNEKPEAKQNSATYVQASSVEKNVQKLAERYFMLMAVADVDALKKLSGGMMLNNLSNHPDPDKMKEHLKSTGEKFLKIVQIKKKNDGYNVSVLLNTPEEPENVSVSAVLHVKPETGGYLVTMLSLNKTTNQPAKTFLNVAGKIIDYAGYDQKAVVQALVAASKGDLGAVKRAMAQNNSFTQSIRDGMIHLANKGGHQQVVKYIKRAK